LSGPPPLVKLTAVENNEQQQYFSSLPFPEPVPNVAPIGPDNPPWGSWIAIAAWMASVLLIAIVPMIFLLPYLLSQGIHTRGQEELARFATSDPAALLLQMAAIVPAHLITLAIGWAVVTQFKRHPFLETLGWHSGGMRWWHYVLILFGFFAVAGVVTYLVPSEENDMVRILRSSRLVLYTVAALAVLTAPFVEELIYRGILYSPLQRAVGAPLAVVVVTLLFSAVHVPQYWGTPSTIVLLTLLSLILTVIRAKTGSLLPCVILHTVFNATQSLLMIASPEFQPRSTTPQDVVGFLFF
jgi:membrane protease YdiL (CAAX protease family)